MRILRSFAVLRDSGFACVAPAVQDDSYGTGQMPWSIWMANEIAMRAMKVA